MAECCHRGEQSGGYLPTVVEYKSMVTAKEGRPETGPGPNMP